MRKRESEADLAADFAVRLADRKAVLPLSARSHTPAEFAALAHRRNLILWAVYVALMGGTLAALALAFGVESGALFWMVAVLALIGGAMIHLAMRWQGRRQNAYRDPGLEIEVGEDGVVVRHAGGADEMRWPDIAAQVHWSRTGEGVYFQGLWVESAAGWMDLRDEHYRNGRIAAAAIVRGMIAARRERERSKVERIR